jgi:non-ribosomal peptide synthetase-like protein
MVEGTISTAAERHTTAYAEPVLLHAFFEHQAALRPDHPAVECKGETLTYRELDEAANWIAAALRTRCVEPGTLVALYLKKSVRLFAAMLGILKAGGGYLPIDPGFPIGRVETILEDADVPLVISDGDLGETLQPHISAQVLRLDDEFFQQQQQSSPPIEPVIISPDDVCYVIYTSGTTGRPKGVIIEHRNVVNFIKALHAVYGLEQGDRIYQGFSIAFDASVEEIWAAFSLGGTLVVPSEEIARSALDAAEFINSQDISYFSTVPSFLAMINADLPTVRLLIVGGEPCAPQLVNRWAKSGRRLLNTYGPTETTVVATAADCNPGEPVTIGTALPGYVAYVLDEQMRPVGPGESGELYIGGAGVARGYLNRPDLTAERFLHNLPEDARATGPVYRTFDFVRLAGNGALQYLGRTDAQVKIRGFRIELPEIEAVLMEHPKIQAAAVSAVDMENFTELAAHVVSEHGLDEQDRQGILQMLRHRLPEYMVPKYLDLVSKLPITTSGKIDRNVLPPPVALLAGAHHTVVPPATELEREIAKIWEHCFQISPISVEDDFFLDLRGHSLIAARVATDVRAALGTVRVSVPDLYEYRTVRLLAAHLASLGVKAPSAIGSSHDIEPGPGEAATQRMQPRSRWICAALQFFGVLVFYAVSTAPLVLSLFIILDELSGGVTFQQAAYMMTILGFLIWPSWLLLSIALKWIVIGRYRPGRYPVWGFYYFRWWLVTRFQMLSWSEMFVDTPFMSLYYRAMGAKVGRYCTIGTPLCAAFDLVTIGDGASIGPETQLLGYRIEDGWLILGTVSIGQDCFVGTHCCLGLDTVMHDGARLGDMSLLADHCHIDAGQDQRGSPAVPTALDLPDPPRERPRRGLTFLFGLVHLALIYAMGYLLILSMVPAVIMAGYALYTYGAIWGIGAAFASVPVTIVWYLLLVLAVKRLSIGRIRPGNYSLHSGVFLRYWFLNYLLNNTRHLMLPFYATLFLPPYLRLLGARVGRRVEISTAMHMMPDLLMLGDGSFLADACMVGGHRIHRGFIDISSTCVGSRTFIGNSALVPEGVDIGDNCLIGVMSTPPDGMKRTPDGTRWLGSPGFELPLTQQVGSCNDGQTFNPPRKLVLQRIATEIIKLLLPGFAVMASFVSFCGVIVLAYRTLPLWQVLLAAPVTALVFSIVAIALVAAVKLLVMGRFVPVVRPLWCGYVWRNELVTAFYEAVAAPILALFLGTPFVSAFLRMMGCKIGRWVFLETTLFSEFDLVEIGDHAALNLGSTVQTHLFEDRMMKSDYLKIGSECSVGNMTVILYATTMQQRSSLAPLSVLMKGETLPSDSRWAGIPTRPVDAVPVAEIRERTAAVAELATNSDDSRRGRRNAAAENSRQAKGIHAA